MHLDRETVDIHSSRRELLRNLAVGATATVIGFPAIAGHAAATGDGVQRLTFDVTGTQLFNPCTDETIEATQGSVVLVIHEHTDENGGTHFSFNQHLRDLEAVGLDSGRTYYGLGTVSESIQAQPPYPQTFTLTATQPVVTRGPTSNAVFKTYFTLVVNANGEVVVEDLVETVECR